MIRSSITLEILWEEPPRDGKLVWDTFYDILKYIRNHDLDATEHVKHEDLDEDDKDYAMFKADLVGRLKE